MLGKGNERDYDPQSSRNKTSFPNSVCNIVYQFFFLSSPNKGVFNSIYSSNCLRHFFLLPRGGVPFFFSTPRYIPPDTKIHAVRRGFPYGSKQNKQSYDKLYLEVRWYSCLFLPLIFVRCFYFEDRFLLLAYVS